MSDDEVAQPAEETPAPLAPAEAAAEILPQETPAPTEAHPGASAETPEVAAEPVSEPISPSTQAAPTSVGSTRLPIATSQLRSQALEARQAKIRNRHDSILAFAKQKKSITNKDVQLHCHISGPTATRDLEQLVKDSRLKRVGKQKRPTYELA